MISQILTFKMPEIFETSKLLFMFKAENMQDGFHAYHYILSGTIIEMEKPSGTIAGIL